jgi:hypothetical protein
MSVVSLFQYNGWRVQNYDIDRLCGPHKLRRYFFEGLDEASSLPMPFETNTSILSDRTAWPLFQEVNRRESSTLQEIARKRRY